MKKLLICILLSLLINVPVYASDEESVDYFDVLEEYDITNSEELEDILFQHYYFCEEYGMDFSSMEDAIALYFLINEYDADYEDVDRALYCYDQIAWQDVYDEDGNYIDIDPPKYKKPKPSETPETNNANEEVSKNKESKLKGNFIELIPVFAVLLIFLIISIVIRR